MSQSRLASATEATANIAIGYTVAVAAQVAIFPQRIDSARALAFCWRRSKKRLALR